MRAMGRTRGGEPLGRGALLVCGTLLALVAGVVVGIVSIEQQLRMATTRSDGARVAQVGVLELDNLLSQESGSLGQYALTRDPAALAAFEQDTADFGAKRKDMAGYLDDPDLGPAMRRVLAAADEWQTWAVATQAAISSGSPQETDFETGDSLLATFERANVVLAARAQQSSRASAAEVNQLSSNAVTLTVLAAALGAPILVGALWLLFASTLRPIRALAEAAGELAAGGEATIPTGVGAAEVRTLAAALESWRRGAEARLRLAEETMQAGAPFTVERVLEAGARAMATVVGAPQVAFTIGGRGGPMTARMEDGKMGPLESTDVIPAQSPSRAVEASGRPLITDLRDERWAATVRDYADSRGWGPALVVPLRSGGQRMGEVTFIRGAGDTPFEPIDVQIVEPAAAQLSGALHVAQLLAELRAANLHKNEFLAHMSHELRTPLNSVLGFGQLLADPTFGTLNDRQRRYLDHVVSSGTHLLALINDALDLSRVEAGELKMQPERVSVRRVLAECAADLRPLAFEKLVELRPVAGAEVDVFADRRRVVQIVLNLLSNAIKFTPEGGTVTLSASRDGDAAVVTVRDTGIGIADADQERIFQAFTQLGSGRTRSQDGTGLGLTLSRRLAQQMGGSLTVESQEGVGSSFHLRLPVASAALTAPVSDSISLAAKR